MILGLNEENDWKCINYYKKHEESPSISFSPDADFPCIYAEKSILTSYLKMDYERYLNQALVIKDIDTYGNAINVVPKTCHVTLKVDPSKIEMNAFIQKLKNIIEETGFEIDIYKIDSQEIKLTSYGTPSHAAHPELGVNAISRLIIVLAKLFKSYKIKVELLDFFEKYLNTDYHGENLGISLEDESRKVDFKCR